MAKPKIPELKIHPTNIVTLLFENQIAIGILRLKSKGDAKRLIQYGKVKLGDEVIWDKKATIFPPKEGIILEVGSFRELDNQEEEVKYFKLFPQRGDDYTKKGR